MISEKKTEEKIELSLQELEEITGGYVCEKLNTIEVSSKINISRLPGNIVFPFPIEPPFPPPILPGLITINW